MFARYAAFIHPGGVFGFHTSVQILLMPVLGGIGSVWGPVLGGFVFGIVEEEIGEEMIKRVDLYRDLLARTPVDELEVRSRPRVIFRVDEVTWIDAIVRYLVSPREAGSIKSRLIPKLLAALNAAPERVMFPKGDAR